MKSYEQNLHITDQAFDSLRASADMMLQKLLKNLVQKGEDEGSLTIKIDVDLLRHEVDNFDPAIEGTKRQMISPKFSFKVSTAMQVKNEDKQNFNAEGLELVLDEVTGEYILRPVSNINQRSMFDADYREVVDPEPDPEEEKRKAIAGNVQRLLGMNEEEDEDSEDGFMNDPEDDEGFDDFGPEDDEPEDFGE